MLTGTTESTLLLRRRMLTATVDSKLFSTIQLCQPHLAELSVYLKANIFGSSRVRGAQIQLIFKIFSRIAI